MYEAYSDYESMMNMAEEIVTRCALAVQGKLIIDYQVRPFFVYVFCGGWGISDKALIHQGPFTTKHVMWIFFKIV